MFRWIGFYILIRIVQSLDDQYLFSNFHLRRIKIRNSI